MPVIDWDKRLLGSLGNNNLTLSLESECRISAGKLIFDEGWILGCAERLDAKIDDFNGSDRLFQ